MTDVATARPNALTSAPPLRTHAAVRAWIMASRWVLGLSYLLAAPSKIAGHEFARAAKDPAIHEFFAHLLAIGPLWRLMGVAQLVAGVCLLIPRTAALGALVALGVTAGIEVTLWSQGFNTADRVAGLILGAMQLSLLVWEYPRLRLLLSAAPDNEIEPQPFSPRWRSALRATAYLTWAGFLGIGIWHYVMRRL